MLKKMLVIILVYVMTIPINYIPFIKLGVLRAKKYRVTIININANGDASFSKRMTQFLKDELETKNRIEYFNHNIELELKTEPKKEKLVRSGRTYDKSVFEEIADLKTEIKQQVLDQEYAMLVESWSQIIEIYEEHFENLKTIQPLFEAYLNKAFYEGLEEMDETKDDLRQAIAIGRNLIFDNSGFSPRFLIKYERERKRGKKKAKAIFTLDATANHELIIDGISMGKAPVKVTGLSYGKHFIIVLDANKIVKKKAIELTKKKKSASIKIKSKKKDTTTVKKTKTIDKEKTDSQLISFIDTKLSKNEFDTDLKDNLDKFAKKITADFIILGNTVKKHDMYNASIFIYNAETKQIADLTKGEFDTDLLTGDVEGLRIGNEIVKGIDNFSTLKVVTLKKKQIKKVKKEKKGALRVVPFIEYKKLKFNKSVAVAKTDDSTTSNSDSVDLSKIDTIKTDKNNKKDIDLANADYSDLDDDSGLNKYDKKEEDDGDGWYSKWWVWTIVGAVAVGATAGTVYILTQDEPTTVSTPSGTW